MLLVAGAWFSLLCTAPAVASGWVNPMGLPVLRGLQLISEWDRERPDKWSSMTSP